MASVAPGQYFGHIDPQVQKIPKAGLRAGGEVIHAASVPVDALERRGALERDGADRFIF